MFTAAVINTIMYTATGLCLPAFIIGGVVVVAVFFGFEREPNESAARLDVAPPRPLVFTELEWLALFPSFSQLPRPLYEKFPIPEDPAADLRKKEPITKDRIIEPLSKWPALQFASKLAFLPFL
jgi:hypothetical protein